MGGKGGTMAPPAYGVNCYIVGIMSFSGQISSKCDSTQVKKKLSKGADLRLNQSD